MNIKKVGNVILAVKDLNKSLEFYNKIIGLPIQNKRTTWIDLGSQGTVLSLHPISQITARVNTSIDNGIAIGFIVGDLKSVIAELKNKHIRIFRDIIDKNSGKNALILDPDDYIISLFEPSFIDKDTQTTGYCGFTPQ